MDSSLTEDVLQDILLEEGVVSPEEWRENYAARADVELIEEHISR